MDLIQKILYESHGVPIPILTYVEQIETLFARKPLVFFSRDFSTYINFNPQKDFPLKKLYINYTFRDIDSNKIYAEGGTNNDKIQTSSDGSFSAEINLDVSWDYSSLLDEKNKNLFLQNTSSLFIHELTHLFENFSRKNKNNIGLIGAKHNSSALGANSIMRQFPLPEMLKKFLFYMYCSASFEVSARIAQVYAYIKNEKNPEKRLEIIKSTDQWKIADELSNFTYEKFYSDFKNELIEAGAPENQIGDLFKKVFLRLREKLTEFEQIFFNQDYFAQLNLTPKQTEQTNRIFHSSVSKAEQVSKNSPEKFVKYWVKAFNYAGEKSKRKLIKLAKSDI